MEIGVWGDSITYGSGDKDGLGWVGRIRREFFDGDNTSVYNRGVCGDTTEDILKRFLVEVESIEPKMILFAVGINDSKYPAAQTTNKIPIEKFQENISQLLEQAKGWTEKIFVLGLTRVDEGAIVSSSRFLNEDIHRYDSLLKNLAERQNLPFINLSNILDTKVDLHDGLHPNAQGYEKMAEVILKVVQ